MNIFYIGGKVVESVTTIEFDQRLKWLKVKSKLTLDKMYYGNCLYPSYEFMKSFRILN